MENIFEMQDKIRVKYPADIKHNEMVIMHHKTDLDTANAAKYNLNDEGKKVYPITIDGKTYTDRKEGGNAIKTALGQNISRITEGKTVHIGEYRGMQLSVLQKALGDKIIACLDGEKPHYCELNPETDSGNIIRLDNCINNIAETIKKFEKEIADKKADLEAMKIDVEKPFPKAEELQQAEARIEEVREELTHFELCDDSQQKDLYERVCEQFPAILSGKKEAANFIQGGGENLLKVSLKNDIFTISDKSAESGELAALKVDYANEKLVPIRYENVRRNDVQTFADNENPTQEEAKQKNRFLNFVDNWLDEIDEKKPKEIDGANDRQARGNSDINI